jgi:hypothetical protein
VEAEHKITASEGKASFKIPLMNVYFSAVDDCF